MAREHDEPAKAEGPQVVEREVTLSLLNAKINEQTNLLVEIANKVGVKNAED